jgi:hypothetical protein
MDFLPHCRNRLSILSAWLLAADCHGATILNQVGDAGTYDFGSLPNPTPSQIFTDFPDFNCMVLEDFTCTGSELEITSVEALFRADGGFAAFQEVQGFMVNVFSDSALLAGTLAGDIASLTMIAGLGVSVTQVLDGSGNHEYGLVNLDLNLSLPSPGKYWIGVSPIASSAVAGQFFMQPSNATIPQAANARFANPAQGFGGDALSVLGSHFAYSVTAVPEPAFTFPSALILCACLCSRQAARKRR